MTIDEAIKHCEEVIQEKQYEYQECIAVHDMENAIDCAKCGEEHRQLAEWLKELKAYKDERVGCEYCKHKFREQHERPCSLCKHNFMDMFESEVNANDE